MADRRPRERGESGPWVYGVHPVAELVERRPQEVERVYASTPPARRLGPILKRARVAGIPVTYLGRALLARKLGPRAVHQGIAAQVAGAAYASVDQVCDVRAEAESARLVAVDGVVDPGNLGAIVRTCAAAGVDGILLASEGTAGLTPVTVKASAGTLGRVPVAREPKLPARLGALRNAGFRNLGLVARGGTPWDKADLTGRIVFVAGGEEKGIRPGVLEACDARITIPLADGIESLNVGIALGVLLFESLRQQRSAGSSP